MESQRQGSEPTCHPIRSHCTCTQPLAPSPWAPLLVSPSAPTAWSPLSLPQVITEVEELSLAASAAKKIQEIIIVNGQTDRIN